MSQLELKHCIQCTELKEITKFKNQYTKKNPDLEKENNADICADCKQMKRILSLITEYKKLRKACLNNDILLK